MLVERARPIFATPQSIPQEIAVSEILHNLDLVHLIPLGGKGVFVIDSNEVSVKLGTGPITKPIGGQETRVIPMSFYNGYPKPLRMNLPEQEEAQARKDLGIKISERRKIGLNGVPYSEDRHPAPEETQVAFFKDAKTGELIIENIVVPSYYSLHDQSLPQLLEDNNSEE